MENSAMRHEVVLLAGMQRAGTAWFYSLLNDLWLATGGQDARELRARYHLEKYMSRGNALVAMRLPNLFFALWPFFLGNSYVIKTHTSPAAYPRRIVSTWFSNIVIRRKWVIPLYIYRDPRDVILSAYEYGKRAIAGGRPNAFSNSVQSIEMGIDWMQVQLITWASWVNYPGVLVLRYEDLLDVYDVQIARVLQYLQLDPDRESIKAVLAQYRPGQPSKPGTHFHKGVAGRFRDAFTDEQKQLSIERFGAQIKQMGYPL